MNIQKRAAYVVVWFSMLPLLAVSSYSALSKPEAGKSAADYIRANIAAEASKDESTTVTIGLKNAQGKLQERTLQWKTVTLPNGDKRSIVVFLLPKSIKGTGLLVQENKGKEDERWLYLPSLKKTRRISGADKSDTFMGTDFSYEDLVTEEMENHSYSFDQTQDCGKNCVVVIAEPKSEKERAESGYSKRRITIDTTNGMITAVEYYNRSGVHWKSFRASDFRKVMPSGDIRPYRMEMTDVIGRHSSTMVFDRYSIDAGVDPDEIPLRALTQGQ